MARSVFEDFRYHRTLSTGDTMQPLCLAVPRIGRSTVVGVGFVHRRFRRFDRTRNQLGRRLPDVRFEQREQRRRHALEVSPN